MGLFSCRYSPKKYIVTIIYTEFALIYLGNLGMS